MRLSPAVIAVFCVSIIGFASACIFAAEYDRFEGDLWATRELQEFDGEPIETIIDVTEDIGDDPIVIGIWIGAGVVFYLVGSWAAAGAFVLAGLLRQLVPLLKEIIERPRPPAELVDISEQPGTYSFPSGHATTAIALFGLIFYFTQVYVKQTALRLAIQAACVWMMVIVGIERVYAGEHWPSDVLGGIWLGGMIVAVNVYLHQRLGRRGLGE